MHRAIRRQSSLDAKPFQYSMQLNPSSLANEVKAQAAKTQESRVKSPDSIRLWLSICNTSIGFESLFEALARCEGPARRALHIKRVLIQRRIDQSNPVEMPTEHKRLKIDLSIGFRDIGLEWLLADLKLLSTPFQKSTFVLRQLYLIGNSKPEPQLANVSRPNPHVSPTLLPVTMANKLSVREEAKSTAAPKKPGFSRAAIDDIVAPRSH